MLIGCIGRISAKTSKEDMVSYYDYCLLYLVDYDTFLVVFSSPIYVITGRKWSIHLWNVFDIVAGVVSSSPVKLVTSTPAGVSKILLLTCTKRGFTSCSHSHQGDTNFMFRIRLNYT